MIRRALFALLSVSAMCAAAAVLVVALAFALYAYMEPMAGRPGAAAVVALAVTILMAGLGLILARSVRMKPKQASSRASSGALEKGLAMLQEKPVVAAVVGIAVGLLAAQNPKYLGSLARSFVDGKTKKG